MNISKFNSEGYYDPTVFEALTNLKNEQAYTHKYRPLVYICSPYSGDISKNQAKARRYSKFASDRGVIPVAPHLLFPQFLDDSNPDDRSLGLFFGIVLLTKCEQLWAFGTRISSGMEKEIRFAENRGISVRYFTEELEEVAK